MQIMTTVVIILMFILGAAFGSFLCCQARRLRERETHHHKLPARSVCLHCHKKLKWYDNLPIISYLVLRGKCRYCHHKIGRAEFLSEFAVATAFALLTAHFFYTAPASPVSASVIFSSIPPLNWAIFATTLLLTLSLAFLAIYDGAYGELPSFCLTFSLICAILIVILRQWAGFSVVSALCAAALFGGLYLILYLISKGKWVGNGDWLLATAIGLALGHPFLALIAIFVANLSATLISAPAALRHRRHQIYFGPYLVLAFVLTYVFSDFLIIP